ncbi:MAG TPA: hypothetical protein PKM21_12135 [Anaerolineales bacterium]|nr:hypothetical protein [Anaerolineales bacterium]
MRHTFQAPQSSPQVDADAGIIHGVSLAQTGQATGHSLQFDQASLQAMINLAAPQTRGIKSRFTHPSMLSDGLGTYLGRVRDLRIDGNKLLGDLHLAQSASRSPAGDLRAYVLSLAAEDPAALGLSVVVDLDLEPVQNQLPAARITAFYSADLVDEPALNPQGLFKAAPQSQGVIQMPQTETPNQGKGDLSVTQNPTPQAPLANEVGEGQGVRSQTPAVSSEALDAITQRLTTIERAITAQTVQLAGPPPRGGNRVQVGASGLDHFANAFDWIFGASGSPLPPPELRRTDNLYRLITGDIEWHGVFKPEYAFASASTTTLADLAANAMNKVIVELYARLAHYRWYEPLVAVQPTDGTLQDMAWIQFGGIANLPVVAEGAAYTELTVADTKESDSFTKYGGYVGITDKMLRNSALGVLQAIPRALVTAAIQTRSAAIASIFTSNAGVGPTLDQDSTALFHTANHGNLATTAYSWAAWKAARLECAKQTELGSSKRQMLFPKYLLVPADLYDQALIDFGYGAGPGGRPGEGTTTGFQDVNPYAMDRPGDPRPVPIAVPEFTDTNDWAYLADPMVAPIICMAYANNPGGRTHPAPELFTAVSESAGLLFTNDTLPIKIRDYFAYGVATYRGIGKRNVT